MTAVEIDVFLLVGQSNALGRGYQDPEYAATVPTIMYPNRSFFRPGYWADNGYQPDNGCEEGSVRSAFVNRWVDRTQRPVGFWKSAVGGTSLFADCQPPPEQGTSVRWWEPTVQPTLFDPAVERFREYTLTLYSYGFTPVPRGVVWIQGENEAEYWIDLWPTQKDALVQRYAAGVSELAAAFRAVLGEPSLPMYVPLLGDHSSDAHKAGYANIREAQQLAAAQDPLVRICFTRTPEFWTDVPPKQNDGVHYKQSGYNEMGHESADYVLADLGVDIDPVPPAPADLASLPFLFAEGLTSNVGFPVWGS